MGRPGALQSMGLQRVRHGVSALTDRDRGKSWLENRTIDSKMKTRRRFQQLCGCLRQEENIQALRGERRATATLRADISRTRKSGDNGLAPVKC